MDNKKFNFERNRIENEKKIVELKADLRLAELSVELHSIGIEFFTTLLEGYKEFIRELDKRKDLTEEQRKERSELLFSKITQDIPARLKEVQEMLNYAKLEAEKIRVELRVYQNPETQLPHPVAVY